MTAPYHHGDLPRALLAAVADLIERDGVGSVSLRAVAREVGVSHSAPLHHFHDKEGLLTAFAVEGFQAIVVTLEAGRDAVPEASPLEQLGSCGRAYLDFAMTHRAHFEVMFRPEMLDEERDDLHDAGKEAFQIVVDIVGDHLGPERVDEVEGLALAAWAAVHGLATLWVDGPLPHMTDRERDSGPDLDAVAAPVLAAMRRAVAQA